MLGVVLACQPEKVGAKPKAAANKCIFKRNINADTKLSCTGDAPAYAICVLCHEYADAVRCESFRAKECE